MKGNGVPLDLSLTGTFSMVIKLFCCMHAGVPLSCSSCHWCLFLAFAVYWFSRCSPTVGVVRCHFGVVFSKLLLDYLIRSICTPL